MEMDDGKCGGPNTVSGGLSSRVWGWSHERAPEPLQTCSVRCTPPTENRGAGLDPDLPITYDTAYQKLHTHIAPPAHTDTLTFELLADFGQISHPLQHLWISCLISVRRLQTKHKYQLNRSFLKLSTHVLQIRRYRTVWFFWSSLFCLTRLHLFDTKYNIAKYLFPI